MHNPIGRREAGSVILFPGVLCKCNALPMVIQLQVYLAAFAFVYVVQQSKSISTTTTKTRKCGSVVFFQYLWQCNLRIKMCNENLLEFRLTCLNTDLYLIKKKKKKNRLT